MMSKYQVEMVTNGDTIRKIRHEGRTYLPVMDGDEFSIRVKNGSGRRVLAIISVDGLDVIGGEEASHESDGYVIGAYQTLNIDGWRTSDETVATFTVGGKSTSYSSKTGRGTKNTGVIGVVVYAEKQVRRVKSFTDRPRGMANFDGDVEYESYGERRIEVEETTSGGIVLNCVPTQEAGTEFGREQVSRVTTVKFERDDRTKEVITLYYDTAKGLEGRGIKVYTFDEPNPFPGQSKYCQRP
jgi:hypothetical protein